MGKRWRERGGTWWWTTLVIVVPVLVMSGLALWALAGLLDAKTDRLEVVRTALAVGAGTGAVLTLVLARRRQWATEHDATERRITELYVKAVEQLGSTQAAVRHGALYALERVAQNNADQRQTVVDVVCAYLRAPFDAEEKAGPRRLGVRRPLLATATKAAPQPAAKPDWAQEREVRRTAQRIIERRLRPGDGHWPGIAIDLTGATLIDLDLSHCTVRAVTCRAATLAGTTKLVGVEVADGADFRQARFAGAADAPRARFLGPADFSGAAFAETAYFADTRFAARADFSRVDFQRPVSFERVGFDSTAFFEHSAFFDAATFNSLRVNRHASFERTTFAGEVRFTEAMLLGGATFNAVRIGGDASFHRASIRERADFNGAVFARDARFHETFFDGACAFRQVAFGRYAGFVKAKFIGEAAFRGARFAADARFSGAYFGGATDFAATTFARPVRCYGTTFGLGWPEDLRSSTDEEDLDPSPDEE